MAASSSSFTGNALENKDLSLMLKQWGRFPTVFEQAIDKPEGIIINGRTVNRGTEEEKHHFFEKVINAIQETQGTCIDPKTLLHLFKINGKYHLGKEGVITDLAARSLQLQSTSISETQAFCDAYQKNSETAVANLKEKQGSIDQNQRHDFAKALALVSPALLFLVICNLEVTSEEQRFLAKLVLSNPLSKGLESWGEREKTELLASIGIEEFINRFLVHNENQNNVRGLLNYLAEQLKTIPEFNPHDLDKFVTSSLPEASIVELGVKRKVVIANLQFLHLINGILKYGVLSSSRAERLGIVQVQSSDNFRAPDTFKANYILDRRTFGESDPVYYKQLLLSLTDAVYHRAKGAFTVALERKNEHIKIVDKRVELRTLLSEDEASMYTEEEKEELMTMPRPSEGESDLLELTERARYCLLVIAEVNKITYQDIDGKEFEGNHRLKQTNNICKTMPSSQVGCQEVGLNSLTPQSVSMILLSRHFQDYQRFLFNPRGAQLKFVDDTENTHKVTFVSSKTCIVDIFVPDFLQALQNLYLPSAPGSSKGERKLPINGVITNMCKGNTCFDLDHKEDETPST